jgi:GTP-binding protein Era
MSSEPSRFRAGFAAVVGRPNVGKSTLTNALVGEKVSIVTAKPQTTRTRVHGIVQRPEAQLVLVDTPGLGPFDSALNRALRHTAGVAASDAGTVLWVAEVGNGPAQLTDADRQVSAVARGTGGPVVVALNKIDKLRNKERLLPWMALYQKELHPVAIVPISALYADGLERLEKELIALLPEGPPMFPTDLYTLEAERFLCTELVRKQLLLQLREEVPYATAVVIESFGDERLQDGSGLVRLSGRIYVERESQKGIVVGKAGARVKEISRAARLEIEKLLGCKVFLRVSVHVDPGWTEKEREVRRFGYSPEGGTEAW